ncbi:MAG: sugar phosphate isomerase/epimerase [Clostridia bacterium]|nr:sugar phosphate isomerase/epimerase [Clostridia bacterium]
MELGIIIGHEREDFEYAKNHGLKFLEICHNIGNDCPALLARADEMNAYIKEYGVKIGSVGRWGTDKIDENGNLIEEELQNSYILIDFCEKVGCTVFNTGVNYVEGLSAYENVTAAINYLQKLVDYGRDKGVRIATYNCDWNNFVRCPYYWKLIHGHIKELGIKYDPTHCINSGSGDYLGEMKEWGDRFYHVHLKGTINVNGDHVDDPPAGMDMINWGAFMGILYKKHYNGTLAIEPHSGTWKGELGEFGVQYTIDCMKKLIF